MENKIDIPKCSLSGSEWDKFTFAKFASDWEMQSKPYKVNVSKNPITETNL